MPDGVGVLKALAAAALVAAAAQFLLGFRRGENSAWRGAGSVLAVGLGMLAGCACLGVRPHWPPREDQDRLLLFLLPAVITVELAAARMGRWVRLPRLAIAAAAAWILLFGSVYLADLAGPGTREWTTARAGCILGGLAAVLTGEWAALTSLVRREGGRSVTLGLALTCAGAGVTVMLSGYASGGLLGLPLAAALVGVVLASLVLAVPLDGTGVTGLALVGLFSLLVIGRFFGELLTSHAVILFLAPLLTWLPGWLLRDRPSPRLRGVTRVVLTAIPVAVIVWLAHDRFVVESSRPGPTMPRGTLDDYRSFGK